MTKKSRIKLRKLLNQYIRYNYDDGSGSRKVCFHPSQIYSESFCARKLFYQAGVFPAKAEDKKKDPTSHKTFVVGHAVHDFFRDRLFGPSKLLWGDWKNLTTNEVVKDSFMPETEGGWTYLEKEIRITSFNPTDKSFFDICGSVDGIIVDPDTGEKYVMDIKTSNKYRFDFFNSPADLPHNYLVQINLYMLALGIDKGVFYSLDKDTSRDREIHVDFDPELVKWVVKTRIEPTISYYNAGELPPRHAKCESNPACSNATRCPYERSCFGQT